MDGGWDEGGASNCGYSDSVHGALMSAGKVVHSAVGDPSDQVRGSISYIGNWFQEASYAVRDLVRGNHVEMGHDIADTVSILDDDIKRVASETIGDNSVVGKSHDVDTVMEARIRAEGEMV